MNNNLVTAVFDGRAEAERAAAELRSAGVPDSALSVIARHDAGVGDVGDFGDAETHDVDDKGEGLLKGAVAGGGIGALLGIAALAIPGVGPLAAAGAIASSAIPGAAAIGAGAGAVAGGLAGLLSEHGVSDDDASYYEERIHAGGVFLSVDASEAGLSAEQLRDILDRNGGRTSATATTDAAAY
jgi:hypothetical protein